jgi:hypothetical protein
VNAVPRTVVDPAVANRRAWRRAVTAARELALGAGGEGLPGADLPHLIKGLRPAGFPAEGGGASAAEMAAAFLACARAFAGCRIAERRALFAPALAATAKALDELMDETAGDARPYWMDRD